MKNFLVLLFSNIMLLVNLLHAQDTTFWGGREYHLTKDRSNATHYSIATTTKKGVVKRDYYMDHSLKRITPFSNFKKNQKHGIDSSFYESGALRSIITFHKGKEDGIHLAYYPNGNLQRKATYKAGKLISGEAFSVDATDTVYTDLLLFPTFPGGLDSLALFMKNNTVYPVESRRKRKEGVAMVTFVVDKYGTIDNIRIIKSVAPDIDEECLRVVRLMPNWAPGTYDGDPIVVQYNLPFRFKLR